MKTKVRITMAILAVAVTLELCARLDDWFTYDAPLFGAYTVDDLYDFDGAVQHGRPHARWKKWQLNSLGFRGPELTAGSIRVLCVGASETFGMLETDGAEYPRQLQRLLNDAQGRNAYDVVNLSYFGMTLPTANRLLPHAIEQVHPSIAIIYPTPSSYIARRMDSPPIDHRDTRPRFALRIVGKLNDLAKAALPLSLQTRLKRFAIERYARGSAVMERVPEDRIGFFVNDLRRTVQLLRAAGVKPLLVTHANRFHDYAQADRNDMLVAWRRFYPLLKEEGLLDLEDRINAAMRRFAVENDVALVDAAAHMPGGAPYFTDYTHFTDTGAQMMARMLAEKVQNLAVAPAAP